MSKRRGRGGGRSSRGRGFAWNINWRPILLFGGIGLGVVAIVLVVLFVFVLGKGDGHEAAEATPSPTVTVAATPVSSAIVPGSEVEVAIEHKSINDPYIYGNEIIFSTGDKLDTAPSLDRLAIYDMTAGTTTEVPGIERKYNSLLEPRLNESYILYLDCKTENGGAICAVDRASGETFVVREYMYGMPKVSLSGQYALWMQQTGKGTDRLYAYDLAAQECVEIETFINTYISYSAAYMSDEVIVYVQPSGEDTSGDLPINQKTSSGSTDAEVVVMPRAEGGDQLKERFLPGTFVYNPLIEGDNIVYLDATGGPGTNLMLCRKNAGAWSAPVVLATDVLNYDVGDGYLVYTLDQAIYIYYFADGSTTRLSSDTTDAMLGSANGKDVIWYDITEGLDSTPNVIMHMIVP